MSDQDRDVVDQATAPDVGHPHPGRAIHEVMEHMQAVEAQARGGDLDATDLRRRASRCEELLHWSLVELHTQYSGWDLPDRLIDNHTRAAYDLVVSLIELVDTAGMILLPAHRVGFVVHRVLELADTGVRSWWDGWPPPGPPVFARRRRLGRPSAGRSAR